MQSYRTTDKLEPTTVAKKGTGKPRLPSIEKLPAQAHPALTSLEKRTKSNARKTDTDEVAVLLMR